MNELYLSHHGILGQKWGVRRFQNKDGTRTQEGRKRYSSQDLESIKNKTQSIDRKKAVKVVGAIAGVATVAAATYLYKQNKQQIDNVVRTASVKLQMNAGMVQAMKNSPQGQAKIKAGKQKVDKILNNPFAKGIKRVGSAMLEGAGVVIATKAANKIFGEETTNDMLDATNAYRKKDDRIKSQKVNEVVQKAAKKEIKNAAKNSFKIKRREED